MVKKDPKERRRWGMGDPGWDDGRGPRKLYLIDEKNEKMKRNQITKRTKKPDNKLYLTNEKKQLDNKTMR